MIQLNLKSVRNICLIFIFFFHLSRAQDSLIRFYIGASEISINKLRSYADIDFDINNSHYKYNGKRLVSEGNSIFISSNSFEEYKSNMTLNFFTLKGLKCESVMLSGSLKGSIDSCTIGKLEVLDKNTMLYSLNLRASKIRFLSLTGVSLFEDLKFSEGTSTIIDSMQLINCSQGGLVSFNHVRLPRYIRIGKTFQMDHSLIDLTTFDYSDEDVPCTLNIEDYDGFDYLRLNYENFKLEFTADLPNWKKEKIYKQQLDEQLKLGYKLGYEKLDREYKEFEYTKDGSVFGKVKNALDEWWWDYGYNKFKVVENSFVIFFIFFFLNILLYSSLLDIYCPDKFREIEQRLVDKHPKKNNLSQLLLFNALRLPSILVYSAYIFWGLKLNLREIEIKRPLVYMTIILEYVTGIICLAYIANYILSR